MKYLLAFYAMLTGAPMVLVDDSPAPCCSVSPYECRNYDGTKTGSTMKPYEKEGGDFCVYKPDVVGLDFWRKHCRPLAPCDKSI
jgi:hypothetical protein